MASHASKVLSQGNTEALKLVRLVAQEGCRFDVFNLDGAAEQKEPLWMRELVDRLQAGGKIVTILRPRLVEGAGIALPMPAAGRLMRALRDGAMQSLESEGHSVLVALHKGVTAWVWDAATLEARQQVAAKLLEVTLGATLSRDACQLSEVALCPHCKMLRVSFCGCECPGEEPHEPEERHSEAMERAMALQDCGT